MIQELLGMVEGRNINIQVDGSSSSFTSTPISSPSSSPSPISSTEPQQNLKCPRCDSSNTKFCYYNNYNLTQPRHFCKTCRRYWTKGGALRNVPIGGGCRRGKPSPPLAAFRSGSNKAKPAPPNVTEQDRELPACPVLWASPYSSQLLALLRASQLQNPNPNPSMRIKDDNTLNAYSHLGQITAGPYQSLWRNVGAEHLINQHQQHYQHNMMSGSTVNEGFLQKMRLSPANCYTEQLPAVMGSASSYPPAPLATAGIGTNSYIMDQLPVSGGDFGYWNAGFLG